MWYIYIVRCNDNKLYTGITNDLKRRLAEHNSGHGSRFTRFRKPVKLVYWQETCSKSSALQKEAGIKRLKRYEKLLLTAFFYEWRKIRGLLPFQIESGDRMLAKSLRISPTKKLRHLEHMRQFISKYPRIYVMNIRGYCESLT